MVTQGAWGRCAVMIDYLWWTCGITYHDLWCSLCGCGATTVPIGCAMLETHDLTRWVSLPLMCQPWSQTQSMDPGTGTRKQESQGKTSTATESSPSSSDPLPTHPEQLHINPDPWEGGPRADPDLVLACYIKNILRWHYIQIM